MGRKLIFNYKRDYNVPISIICNNHSDLESYLISNYDFHLLVVSTDYVKIIENEGYDSEIINIFWAEEI